MVTIRFEYPAPINKKLDDYIHRIAGDHEWEFYASGADMAGDDPKRDICFDADLAWMFDGEL